MRKNRKKIVLCQNPLKKDDNLQEDMKFNKDSFEKKTVGSCLRNNF